MVMNIGSCTRHWVTHGMYLNENVYFIKNQSSYQQYQLANGNSFTPMTWDNTMVQKVHKRDK